MIKVDCGQLLFFKKTGFVVIRDPKSLSHNLFERRIFLFCREVLG